MQETGGYKIVIERVLETRTHSEEEIQRDGGKEKVEKEEKQSGRTRKSEIQRQRDDGHTLMEFKS